MSDGNRDDRDGNTGPGSRNLSSAPSLDTVFDLLSARRRRYVIYYLVDMDDDTVDCDSLVEHVASLEADTDPSAERIDRIAADLYQIHLPKLDDAGVVDFDSRSDTVRFWGQPSIEEYAEHAAMQELPDWYGSH